MLDYILPRNKYLSKSTLQELKNYKYVSGVYTPLETFLNPVWTGLTEFLPTWMAPNLVTLTGLMVTTACAGLILPIDCKSDIGPFDGYAAGFALLAYHTLDSMDGK